MKTTIQNTISNLSRIIAAVILFSCLSFTFKFLAGVQEESRNNTLSKNDIVKKSPLIIINDKQLDKVSKKSSSATSSIKNSSEIENLKDEVASLKAQQEYLKEENIFLRKERDSALSVIENSNEYYGILKSTIKKGSKVWISDVKLNFLKELSNKKFKVTEKAKNTDVIQVGFTVNGSKISLATDKNYYIQIVDSKNNIIGKRERKDFGNMTLEYSDLLTVMYFDKDVEAKADIQTYDLKKGQYRIYIFDDRELVIKSSFELK